MPSEWHLRRHMKRKTPCEAPRVPEPEPKPAATGTPEPSKCQHCGREFTRHWNLTRHQTEGRCAALNPAKKAGKATAAGHITTTHDHRTTTHDHRTTIHDHSTTIHDHSTTTNNTVNVTNHNTVNVMIAPREEWGYPNNFGDENLEYLTPLRLQSMFRRIPANLPNEDACIAMVYMVLSDMFANVDHPENQTAYQNPGAKKEALVVMDGTWVPTNPKRLRTTLMGRAVRVIKDAPASCPADHDFIDQLDACAASGELDEPLSAAMERAFTEILKRMEGRAPQKGQKPIKVPPPPGPAPEDIGIATPAPRRIARSAINNIRNMARLKQQALEAADGNQDRS